MNIYKLDSFDFNLPEHLIAQEPLEERTLAKLAYYKHSKEIKDLFVKNLIDIINPNDLLVFNNTKVIPARLLGYKGEAKINVTLHLQENQNTWLSFIKNSKRLKNNDEIIFSDDFKATVVEKLPTGEIRLFFPDNNLFEKLGKYGYMPLPPYIKRKNINNDNDKQNYQSIFAQHQGAIAAPTASLHFTNNLLQELNNKGIKTTFVTLHVGAGTFLPVKVENINDHKMHSEWGYLSKEAAELIRQTKINKGRVIATGTTVLRTLEHAFAQNNSIDEFKGNIDIFIKPPFKFNVVDALITNFHLPKSTLFMLISAFIGFEEAHRLYQHAIKEEYRFFSYGDCCFLELNK